MLGALQEALAAFSNPMEPLKLVFGVRSIRVFSNFSWDPYYEPLLWFMIYIYIYIYIYILYDTVNCGYTVELVYYRHLGTTQKCPDCPVLIFQVSLHNVLLGITARCVDYECRCPHFQVS